MKKILLAILTLIFALVLVGFFTNSDYKGSTGGSGKTPTNLDELADALMSKTPNHTTKGTLGDAVLTIKCDNNKTHSQGPGF